MDKILVSYISGLSPDLIESLGLDLLKIAQKYEDKESIRPSNTSVVISAAITSYARIHMNKLKLDILKTNGKIFYSDTDSIVTNKRLSDKLTATEIGLLKLEHGIEKGIFISGKLIAL